MKIAVVGGGVVGLTTAQFWQELMRNAEITVFAERYNNITSYVAPGIFRIDTSNCKTMKSKWIHKSYEHYDNIRRRNEVTGVTDISGYIFGNSPTAVRNSWLEEVVPIYRNATEEEFELVNGSWKYGSYFSTLLTQCDVYLPWVAQKLRMGKITFKQQCLFSFDDLHEFDIIMNCTGLGARELCNDDCLVPIRGQLLKVNAPWIKTFFYGGLDTYVIPGFNGMVTLGGSRHFNSENTNICPYENAAIYDRCIKLIPALKTAAVMRYDVGVRPYRQNGIRVDANRLDAKSIMVHNYGHGGHGVSLAPGTALDAIDLALQIYKGSTNTKSKL